MRASFVTFKMLFWSSESLNRKYPHVCEEIAIFYLFIPLNYPFGLPTHLSWAGDGHSEKKIWKCVLKQSLAEARVVLRASFVTIKMFFERSESMIRNYGAVFEKNSIFQLFIYPSFTLYAYLPTWGGL